MGAKSALLFKNPESKSGSTYGLGDLMWILPRLAGYSCAVRQFKPLGDARRLLTRYWNLQVPDQFLLDLENRQGLHSDILPGRKQSVVRVR